MQQFGSGFLREKVANKTSSNFRGRLAATAATAAAMLAFSATPAFAQSAEPAAEEDASAPILVTGSRIVRNGNDAPTPVSVISTEEIQAEAPANIADFVNTLPSVSGSQTAVNNSGSLSNGQSGISALNLRSLGQNRTLVLLDGQRSVGSTATGLVDINTFPQALIARVEVVTGGASSVYGSDAVAGVVNFILDRNYTGIKADYEYGITTYGDIPNHKMSLTGGTEFADGRGHLLASAEYFTQEGVDTIDRDWNNTGFFQIDNPAYTATNGQPRRLVTSGIGSSNFAPGGLITTAGALKGTYFGTINPTTGLATTGTAAFGQVAGQWMVGGDYAMLSEGHASSNSLANDEDRLSLFGRASYEFTDFLTLFGQASYSKFKGLSYYQQTPSTGLVIQRDNAFLPQNIRDAMVTNNLTSITIGTSNAGIGAAGGDTERKVERYVIGGEGDFSTGSLDWNWDGYYQYGKTTTRETLTNTWQNTRMAAMTDAIMVDGVPTCRVNTDVSTANDLPGCVPINRIGVGGVTQEALDFLFAIYPERQQFIKQEVAGINFSTPELIAGWAGPISLAFGGEWRKESVDGYVDPINYETVWLYGNYKVTTGSYTVKEAYVETLVPLFEGAEFNGAFRITDYSTSGTVETWKAGLTYSPVYDVKLRGTWSRDIRAPNLNELYDPGTARTNSVNIPLEGGGVRAEQFIQNLTGSLALKPETAETFGIGAVFTPSFIPGLALSADYFNIKITDAIGSVSAQTTVNLCYENDLQDFCDDIRYVSGSDTDIEYIDLAPFNFASQKASGVDLEASYTMPIGAGDLSLRALGTYYIENVSDNGIDAPNDAAGVNAGGGIPTFTYRITASYAFDSGLTAGLVARGFSDGVYDNDYIECTSGCPESDPTGTYRTINTNKIAGSMYIDANVNYDFDLGPVKTTAFLAIRNLFDRDPVLVGNGPDGNNTPAYPQTNRSLYDTFGRTFRLGVRVKY